MRRFTMTIAALALVTMAPVAAQAETYFGFAMGVTNAPPPPALMFHSAPRVVVVPETRVYRVMCESCDADMFRFGGTWYAYTGGFWYRAEEANGPYRVVDARNVPRAVLFVPSAHWKHHPQGIAAARARRQATAVVVVKERGRDRDRDRDHERHGKHWWRH
jgi:hypothetical protein